MNEKLISAGELAEMLAVSKRTVFRLDSSGKIPGPVRINRSVRWRVSDIELWIRLECPGRERFNQLKKHT